jgi:PIN domain nuclease of toxin-antitoxin system
VSGTTGIILDTHIWIRWINQSGDLPSLLCHRIDEAEQLFISAASIYEFIWLVQRRRLQISLPVDVWLQASTTDVSIGVLPVTDGVARRAARLAMIHNDPMDRLIIATALEHFLTLISLDRQFTHYPELQDSLVHQ